MLKTAFLRRCGVAIMTILALVVNRVSRSGIETLVSYNNSLSRRAARPDKV
jgi:hypothetical protein